VRQGNVGCTLSGRLLLVKEVKRKRTIAELGFIFSCSLRFRRPNVLISVLLSQAALDKITGVAIHINKVKRVQELESHEILGWTVSSPLFHSASTNYQAQRLNCPAFTLN
jgi:hypothetical protein